MRFRGFALAGSALAVLASCHSGHSGNGPLTSEADLPWPAPVQVKQPEIPPALSPADELKTFHMAPGYHVELVASEPLVHDPILMQFDGDGRMWVMEMQGYAVGQQMKNLLQPVNDVAILEDTNHDGVYDKRTVFMDKLILPRAFQILDKNCALIGEPPHLWKACDTNGDLKADTKELVADTFATQGVIEHGASGLYWGMDNMIHVSEHTWNVKPDGGGKFSIVPTLRRGQWGVTQDDWGRIYRNVNTDPLFVDYVDAKYYVRNPDMVRTKGLYESLADQEKTMIWPVRPTLGVNRGYRTESFRPDGSATYYQGVSAPMIYRGDQLPKDVQGQAFVVDGPTNLVHLLSLKDDGKGQLTAADFYKKGEFLASTDERFRPVSLTPGWDGSFYIVDMYRGVSQDAPIQTDYLHNYIMKHKLWQTIHLGRIYRVVYDGMKSDPKPNMLEETPAQLVKHLSSSNGWWRDTAQQLLVQRNDKSVVPALADMAAHASDPRTRLQAMWTLNGMQSLSAGTVMQALGDSSPAVRASAIRLAEPWLAKGDANFKEAVFKRADDPNWQVRRQLAASLGELPRDQRVAPLVTMMRKYGDDPVTVDASISGLAGQEGVALRALLAQPQSNEDAVTMLAGATARSRDVSATQDLLGMATDDGRPPALRTALLKGITLGLAGNQRQGPQVAGGRAGVGVPGDQQREESVKPLALPAKPVALVKLADGSGDIAAAAKDVVAAVTWPGKPKPPAAAPRTPAQEALYKAGEKIYQTTCSGCHQSEGQGAPGVAAKLVGSPFVNGKPQTLVQILTNGKEGDIGLMPPLGASLTDEQLASVLTFIRGSWGNTGAPVDPQAVKEWRAMFAYRKVPWTNQELEAQDSKHGGK